jgi:tRNA modification GTPase
LLAAEGLRLARRGLDALVGRTDTEAMLDALFGRFCIGK